ncbi:MAG: NUDIX domain-containing protein, partial [Acidimicrobiales bacterium]|nr:NUDIX domain-containing protein [Acidimicrobiales bacterium]
MTVPALPAASLVVIDDRPDLHVLLGRRRPGAFVGDMIVYPGGAVDDDDWRLGPALVPGATAPGLSAADAAAYLHAAIRETREEVGLFPDPNEVHDGTAYAAVGHWTTPEEVPRRYDTRFFLARYPGG